MSIFSFLNKKQTLNHRSSFGNYFLFKNTPYWISLLKTQALFDMFNRNPVYFATIMIKARAFSNMMFYVENLKTGELEPEDTKNPMAQKIYSLLNQPNPLQSRWEFLKQAKIFEEVAGNSFIYGNSSLGMKFNIENISTLVNVWPQYMKFKSSGKYFDATAIDEIITQWQFESSGYRRNFEPHEILHRNQPNVNIEDNLIFGRSIGHNLYQPLSNIELAYESRNVLLRNRGMRGVFTSDFGDASGKVALQPEESKSVKEEMKQYGNLEDQTQFFFTSHPLKFTAVDQDVRKLGLFEEIATDAIAVANGHGVPEVLLKLYIEGATFENQEASERRLYQSTVIPEALDFVISLNKFLRVEEKGFKIIGKFDHLPILQENERDKSVSNRHKSQYLKDLFQAGAITYNVWLQELGLEERPDGDKTIFDMDDRQIQIIMGQIPGLPDEVNKILNLNGKKHEQN